MDYREQAILGLGTDARRKDVLARHGCIPWHSDNVAVALRTLELERDALRAQLHALSTAVVEGMQTGVRMPAYELAQAALAASEGQGNG